MGRLPAYFIAIVESGSKLHFFCQFFGKPFNILDWFFQVQAIDNKLSVLAVSFRIKPANNISTEQNGQAVIPKATIVGGYVVFNLVIAVE